MQIVCDQVSVHFHTGAATVYALEELDFSVRSGQFVSIVGPSGCGKTTLLRAIAGLQKPSSGAITSGAERALLVYQENSLFPWMNVLDNACFGLEAQQVPRQERESRAIPLLRRFGLEGRERDWPHQLSVGMKQRIAVIRSFISDPDLLLMDEPFASVDAHMRIRLQQELIGLWEQSGKTVLFVTHDVSEALILSDRVIVLSASPGRVIASINVPFSRPRSPEMVWSPEFQERAA